MSAFLDAAAAFGADGVGDETLALVDVPDMDLLVLAQVGGVRQVFVNGAGPFVIQLAVGHGSAVDFGFEQGSEHVAKEWTSTTGTAQVAQAFRWFGKLYSAVFVLNGYEKLI